MGLQALGGGGGELDHHIAVLGVGIVDHRLGVLVGLGAGGEAVDIDGDSGGYNLQWAWSSAKAAAISIAKNALG